MIISSLVHSIAVDYLKLSTKELLMIFTVLRDAFRGPVQPAVGDPASAGGLD